MDPPILMRIVGRKAPHSAHRRCVSSQLDKTQSLNDGRCIRLRSIAPKHRFDANQKNYSHETAAPVGLCVHAQRVLCRRPSKAVLRRLASVSPSASVELTHAATILQRPLTLSERRCTCLTLARSTQWLRVAEVVKCGRTALAYTRDSDMAIELQRDT